MQFRNYYLLKITKNSIKMFLTSNDNQGLCSINTTYFMPNYTIFNLDNCINCLIWWITNKKHSCN